ncbi:2-hydroxyacid dehydrogenase [Lutibaculum baratangense]|uniref:D-3-phosphoglycerate dehydrogenase n=1 Tax=Lutibaculum baratangense AMV1 TaxID=631454 RepID=V4QXW9_9HYPH|nr:2-hydroxyacid dehydrogenase [Lutibaculum baratangense]ESR24597.1 D-3-phosphoglycerate dehydrogenase [Lutibaculum baratangense AMV1]
MGKPEIIVTGPMMKTVFQQLDGSYVLHRLWEADEDALIAEHGEKIVAIATAGKRPVDATFMQRLPNLKLVANFGVGYDSVDAKWAGENGILVSNTPDVLTDEVADTAVGLILMTLRQLGEAERYLRAGRWEKEGPFPLTKATMRDRRIGIVGLGRIGKAVAKRLDAFRTPISYFGRTEQKDVPYRYYSKLADMARDVDVLVNVAPGGLATRHMIDAKVLDELGPDGVLINIGRGTTVDEQALIAALREGRILSAGLDVYEDEPRVPRELIEMEHVTLLPHVASASMFTRNKMAQLVVDNIRSYFDTGRPVTPVPETPVR